MPQALIPAAPLDPDAVLDRAAVEYLAARGALTTALERAASAVRRGMMRLPADIQRLAAERAREGLELAWRVAILGLDPETRREHGAAYRLTGALSGALGGFGGLPTTLAELPVTTALIMRAIADIARARGLDLGAEEVRRASIEVFAFGGPLEEDDDADLAFWMTRLAGQELAQLIAAVIARYAPVLVTKLGAQAAPLVGAAVGAGLNLVYMAFYQRMARVVFDLLPLERAMGREAARRAFAARVDAKRRARGEDARFGR